MWGIMTGAESLRWAEMTEAKGEVGGAEKEIPMRQTVGTAHGSADSGHHEGLGSTPVGSATHRAGDTSGIGGLWMLLVWVNPRRGSTRGVEGEPWGSAGTGQKTDMGQLREQPHGVWVGSSSVITGPLHLAQWEPTGLSSLGADGFLPAPPSLSVWACSDPTQGFMGSSHILPTAGTPGSGGQAGP